MDTKIIKIKKIPSKNNLFKINNFRKKFGNGGNPIKKRIEKIEDSGKSIDLVDLLNIINPTLAVI